MRLKRNDLPCWYELLFRYEASFVSSITNPVILLRVHNDFVEKSQEISSDSPFIWDYQEKLGFKTLFDKFHGSLKSGKDFGFNGAFKYRGKNGEFTEFLIEIPEVKKYTGQFCERCGGSGIDKSFDFEKMCLSCHGEGKRFIYDYKNAFVVSASFTVFFQIANFFEISGEKTNSALKQLMAIETETNHGDYGGGIRGVYSPYFFKWLKGVSDRKLPEVKKAMIDVWKKFMNKVDDFNSYGFIVDISDKGGLILDCPGDVCGIQPSSFCGKENQGYEFNCHNVDSPAQQITLISGLAALYDIERRKSRT